MSRLWLMVRKDLLRQLRAPMGMLFVLSFPVIFATLLALTFGSGGGSGMPKVDLLVEDLDDSMVSRLLLSATDSEQMAQYFDVERVGSLVHEEMEGVEAAMAAGNFDEIPTCLSDRWLADTTLFGTAAKVREGIEAGP